MMVDVDEMIEFNGHHCVIVDRCSLCSVPFLVVGSLKRIFDSRIELNPSPE